jgi:hypothetical protein
LASPAPAALGHMTCAPASHDQHVNPSERGVDDGECASGYERVDRVVAICGAGAAGGAGGGTRRARRRAGGFLLVADDDNAGAAIPRGIITITTATATCVWRTVLRSGESGSSIHVCTRTTSTQATGTTCGCEAVSTPAATVIHGIPSDVRFFASPAIAAWST